MKLSLVSERREDLIGVAFALDFRPDPRDLAAFVDEERRALDSEVLPTVHVLLLPDAVRSRYLAVDVAEERKIEIVLVLEFHVALRVVPAHPEDDGSLRRDASEIVPETACILRTPGRVVFWIEVEDDLLSSEPVQRDGPPVVRRQREVRCFLAD